MNNEEKWSQLYKGFFACGVQESGAQVRFMLSQNAERETAFLAQDIFARLLPTQKENMARALTCVQYTKLRLGPHVVKATFEQNKKKTEQQITTDIHGLMTGWLKEVITAPPPSPTIQKPAEPKKDDTIRGPGRVVMPAGLEAKLNKSLADKGLVARMAKENTQFLLNEINPLMDEFSRHLTTHSNAITGMGRVADQAHETFASAYRDIGKAGNARVALVKKLVTSAIDMIPVVGSAISAPVGAIIDKFHYDTEILSQYDRRKKTLQDAAIAGGGIGGLVAKIEDKLSNATTLGVSAENLPDHYTLESWLTLRLDKARKLAQEDLESALVKMFSYEGEQTSGLVERVVHNNMMSNMRLRPGQHAQETFRAGMKEDIRQLKQGMSNYFSRTVITDPSKMKKYIELTLWAEYLKLKVTPVKFAGDYRNIQTLDFSIPDPMIAALTHLGIVRKKGTLKTSAQVYKTGLLPYDGGHPNHKLGLLLFFQWYDSINPFDMITNAKFGPELLDLKISEYATAIGLEIERASVSRKLRHDKVGDSAGLRETRDSQIASFKQAVA